MKPTLGLSVALLSLALVAGCGSADDSPSADTTAAVGGPSGTPSGTPIDDPVAEPTVPAGDGDLACLIAGSPWTVSNNDLESQFSRVMASANVTSVNIVGAQTLTVAADLKATFTDNTTNTIKIDMGNGITMIQVQKHRGSSTGGLRATEGKLVGTGWTGRITGSTKTSINGVSAESPFDMPSGSGIGEHPMTYSCADRMLNISVQGSPFQYLFKAS